jgi:hypothetical protein
MILINKEKNIWETYDGKWTNNVKVIDEMVYDNEVGKWIHIDEYGKDIFPIQI